MSRPPDRVLLAFGAILVLVTAALLTAVSYPAPHTGGDNAAYLTLAQSLVEGTGYTELWDPETPPHRKYPPVYPLALALLMALGGTTWGVFKLLSAASISAAVLLAFVWGANRRGAVFGGSLAFLVLLSAGWLQASRWILSEPLFLVWTGLALWAADRGFDGEGGEEDPPRNGGAAWLAVAGGAAILAFFTRSAGLPLVVAFLGVLLLRRRFRAAGLFSAAFALPAAWWALRARRGGEGAYQDEFWLLDPYDPELGTIGIFGLVARAGANLRLYFLEVIPGEWWGSVWDGWGLGAVGLLLAAAAAVGWLARVRSRIGVAELFLPLYLGLILLWPEVWSGDRFSLPLYPLLLFYAGSAILDAGARFGARWGPVLAPALVLALALPALPAFFAMAEVGGECRSAAERGDVFRCHGPGFVEFRDAAAWAGANLDSEAVVITRKPRIFYALGGNRSRIYPFTRNPDELLAAAEEMGARYLLLDRVDGVSGFYLPPILLARLDAFCHVAGWGPDEGSGTDLFGILPPGERWQGELEGVPRCPPGWSREPALTPQPEGERLPRRVER